MKTASPEAKVHQLWDLRHKDPAKLIATYRRVADMEVDETLPADITYDIMIDTIAHSGRDPLEKRPTTPRWR